MASAKPAVVYSALAVSLGYTLKFAPGTDPVEHGPSEFHLRDIHVFETARGWRVAKLDPVTQQYMMPASEVTFFARLGAALCTGVERARPATEADLNPLLPHLRAVLRQRQDGDVSNGRNPYCDDTVKAALKAIKDFTGSPCNWMDVNEPLSRTVG